MIKFDFETRAKAIHGNKYIYDSSKYVNSQTYVEIICPDHGSFFQKPKRHLAGRGCPKCGGTATLSQEDFVNRSRTIHKNKYNYTLSKYKNYEEKIIIICPDHGEFLQSPHMHLSGQGCPRCGGTGKLSQEDFINKAKKVHGDKYNYSRADYKNYEEKIIIICPDHGEFLQSPHMHLSGNGCSLCAGNKKLSLEEFINQANKIHNGKYNYEKTKYISGRAKIIIICPDHGEFKCQPNRHIFGRTGCPKCKTSKGETIIRNFLIKNNISFEEQKKFDSCKNKRCLPFDFYLEDLKILIEFQGKQHFCHVLRSKKYSQTQAKNNLIQIQHRDHIKKDWCKNNNIKLLEISYLDILKIDEIVLYNINASVAQRSRASTF